MRFSFNVSKNQSNQLKRFNCLLAFAIMASAIKPLMLSQTFTKVTAFFIARPRHYGNLEWTPLSTATLIADRYSTSPKITHLFTTIEKIAHDNDNNLVGATNQHMLSKAGRPTMISILAPFSLLLAFVAFWWSPTSNSHSGTQRGNWTKRLSAGFVLVR